MVRLIIIILLAYFAYKLFRGLLSIGPKTSRQGDSSGIVSEMVEDPLCNTYIPRNEAYRSVVNGEELFSAVKSVPINLNRVINHHLKTSVFE